MKYWALDYVNGRDGECELVYNDQLYATEADAAAAREATKCPDLFDITWYTTADLRDTVYCLEAGEVLEIDKDLKVHIIQM